MKRCTWTALAAAAGSMMFLTGSGVARDQGKAILTDEQYSKYVAADAKFLNDALAGEKVDKKMARKVQAAALMIGACAESSNHAEKKIAQQLSQSLFSYAASEDWKSAKKVASLLYPKVTAPTSPVAVGPNKLIAPYMYFFANEKVGGFNVEQELGDFMESKDKMTDAQFARLAEISYRTAALGKTAERFGPEKDDGMQTKKNWLAFAVELQQDALGLGAAATAKNEPNTRKALDKLDATCTKCHDVFK